MTAAPEIARPGDRATVVADLLAAFMDDPVLSWVFPDRRRRHRYGGHFFALQGRGAAAGGAALQGAGAAAVSGWAALEGRRRRRAVGGAGPVARVAAGQPAAGRAHAARRLAAPA